MKSLKKLNSLPEDDSFEFLIEQKLQNMPPYGILFLDEFNRASMEVIKTFFTILEDRAVHGKKIVPDGVQNCCCH